LNSQAADDRAAIGQPYPCRANLDIRRRRGMTAPPFSQSRAAGNPTLIPRVANQCGREGIEKQIEHWIRFGHNAAEQILDRRRRILSFAPDSVFAYVR
jgi:Protein of unknown function (DUF2840)